MGLKRYWAYFKAVMRHKKFVFLEGRKLGVPLWMLILHDWDKFLPAMFISYAQCFYKADGSGQYVESDDFDYGWNGHQKLNKHHWQYWVLLEDSGAIKALKMPEIFAREMLADWRGAGRAYNPDWTPASTKEWYLKNPNRMRLHVETRKWIEQQLGVTYEDVLGLVFGETRDAAPTAVGAGANHTDED